MFITIPSLRMTHAPRSDYRGGGAGGRHKAALARLHSVGSLNRSHDCTAEGRGSSLAPTGRRSFAEQLRDLQRRWFADAVAHNVPLMLSLFLQQAGALDVAGQTMVATVKGERTITLTRRIAQPAHLLQVRVNGLLVFNNEEPANELIVPGQWLRVVGEAVEQWQASREARQRADADGVRLVMIETLGADV